MKNNSLLTYVLYGLLALIIVIAGYYTCQRQKEQKLKKEQDEAELQQTLNNMGYGKTDSSAVNGSAFIGADTTKTPATDASKPVANNNGIVNEPAGSATQPTTATKTPPTTKPTTTKPTSTAPTSTGTTKPSVAGPGAGRWAVRAGTFSMMEGARRRLEQVIKLGYTKAEISKTKDGKAAVVVFRSNDKNAALQVVEKLNAAGVDAAVFDRNK
jgi:cell division septation protein DedD